ncbi:hypothetical protein RN87_11135 [Fusobacterium hwasookii ChDC F174]|uniref:Uncharacterized protein n=1 Tax=Fusobacterium hwasookii ChDC F174 TaxID=1307442 RepID=A0A0S2ZQL7_9FUSO|nr:hypothetical protein [Fusobacterium hwasookii]ALQ41062.1 hypothetical protein RN87_11135 [Fusobacterium hwasookii ChDC F174]
MSEDKKLKEEFCVVLNISSNLEEEKLLHRYKMFIRDIKIILKDNNFNEYEINLEDNIISINILNNTLKEMANVLKCLAYIQIMAIEKYKFLLKGVVEYNKKDLVNSFEEKEFNYPLIMLGDSIKEDMLENFSQSSIKISDKFYINYLSIYYEDNNEDDFFNIMLKHKKFIKERLIENSKDFYKIMGISGKRILEKQFFYMEFEKNLKKQEEFYQIKAKLEDNEKNILKIREKYLYLLNYHKKIVFSLIKFEGYEEDRRRKCSINLEEII